MSNIVIEEQEEVIVFEEPKRLVNILGVVGDWLLIALVFLTPLFYLTVIPDTSELPKQVLLLTLVTLAGIVWLVRVFLARAIIMRKSFLFFPIILFLVVFAIATILSLDRYTSFLGGLYGEYASFASLVGFIIFAFLFSTSSSDMKLVRRSLAAFFVASFFVNLISIFSLFGVHVFGTPAGTAWNPVGTIFTLSIFSAFTILLASGILLFDKTDHKRFLPGRSSLILKTSAWLAGILSLFTLILVDWQVGWTLLVVGTGLLLVFVFVYATAFKNIAHLLLPIFALVIALLFMFVKTPFVTKGQVVISPSSKASVDIVKGVLRDHPVLGSGPATYFYDYAQYHSSEVNNTSVWNVRFDRANSQVLTLLPTVGIVGALLWLFLVVSVLVMSIRSFLRERDPTAWLLTVSTFFAWLMLVIASVLYQSNMTIEFLFWFSTVVLIVSTSRTLFGSTFSSSPRILIGTSIGTVAFIVLMLALFVLGAARFSAWTAFAKATTANQSGDETATRNYLTSAATRDPRTDVFYRNIAQARLVDAGKATEIAVLRDHLNAAVNAATIAANIAPKNVMNWETLGDIYAQMSSVVTGAGDRAIESYTSASELEPQNPIYPTNRAKVRVAMADQLKPQTASKEQVLADEAKAKIEELLSDSERDLEDAIDLKQDYAPAHYYTAVLLERRGKTADAVKKLEEVMQSNPRDIGVLFQLGLLYLKQKDNTKAEAVFKRAVELSPDFANAHWYLSAIYEAKGDFTAAISEVEAVLKTNPDNETAKQRIELLKQGKAAAPGELPKPIE